jgi:3-carboxy-cis,cis-muconate cycloisomerase
VDTDRSNWLSAAVTHETGSARSATNPDELSGGFQPLVDVFGDADTRACFSESATIAAWLEVERALAVAQGELAIIPSEAVDAILDEAVLDRIDLPLLRTRTRVVGYPILPLLEQLEDRCSPLVGRYLHWGATTQDIVDSGRALQIAAAVNRAETLLVAIGDALSVMATAHAETIMVGRTHTQHAVPITLGMKLAVWLDEFTRHLTRIRSARPRVTRVQLFGAAGTAAALGPHSMQVRRRVAEQLGLTWAEIPWHVARDNVAEIGFAIAAVASTCSKIAREVIELSRPELNELREAFGELRGASSTMPQKQNPVASETIVGLAIGAQACVAPLLTAMLGTHERAAGEWQAEWDAVPTVFAYGAASLAQTLDLISGLQVRQEQMRTNLGTEGGLLMAEALMMHLAVTIGRSKAHQIVYAACGRVRGGTVTIGEAAAEALREAGLEIVVPPAILDPSEYLGEAVEIVARTTDVWAAERRVEPTLTRDGPVDKLASNV